MFLIGLIIFSIRLARHRSSPSRDSFPPNNFNDLNRINVSNHPKKLGMRSKVFSNKSSNHSIHSAPPAYSRSQPYRGLGNDLFDA